MQSRDDPHVDADAGSSSCGHCDHHHEESKAESISLIVSGVLVGGALLLPRIDGLSSWATAATAFAAMLAGGWFLLPKAWRAVLRLRPDINLLVTIAAVGASIIGEWVEAATVVFLFGVAEWLEGWADRRARRAVEALLEIAPKTAAIKRGNQFVETPVGEAKIGDVVAVKSAMRIPLDGEVVAGESAVNQAPITGESVPVDKKSGDQVFAGTINGEGSLEIQVTKVAGDSTLARIIRLVKEAQEQKAPTQRFVDLFARYYTPSVTIAALAIFVVPPLVFGGQWSDWLYRACVLLIIACPCALVISTPVSIVAGLTAMARRGVLIKGGAHLESIARLRALAVDKTGTITEGKPTVQGVEAIAPHTAEDVLRIAAAIDSHSAHPLASAVVRHAEERGVKYPRALDYQSRSGRGAQGVIDGHAYFVGNHRFTHELGVCSEEIERRLAAIESRGQSVVVVGHRPHDDCNGEVLGIIGIGDAVRENAASAIQALHRAGVEAVVMLSGDNQRTVDFISKQVGIDEARGDLLPEQKVAVVKALRDRYETVGMVGDGVNDAPAMATATVGIAMGVAGTDAAIETADVTLMQDDLAKIVETVSLARRTLGIIRFNIVFALALKLVFLVLALAGYASLWLAILADTGATLLVVANDSGKKSVRGVKYRYYTCSLFRRESATRPCAVGRLSADALERVVIALIGEASKHPTLIGEMVEVSRRMRVGDRDALRREVDRIKEALTVVDKKLRNCAEAVANDGADALREALIRRAADLRDERQRLLVDQERARQALVASEAGALEERRIRDNLERLGQVLPNLPRAERKELIRLFVERVDVRGAKPSTRRKPQEDPAMASATAARVMEINIKLHLAELVRGMEERAAAQSESAANRRAISIRGLDLGARVDFSNAQRGEVAIVAPFGQVLRIQDRVRTVPKPKPSREHPIIRAHKWHQMLQSGEVASRSELAKRMKLTPGAITRILKLIELEPSIQAYLAELKSATAILHFGYHPLGALVRLRPEEQRMAFDRMRTEYELREKRRLTREGIITLATNVRSSSKTPRISAG